jgi:D-alanyl-lipoteichoic acid acyltransferase DltB (MBOAT superfamily)
MLAIVLPLGISFHTLQSISYVVDVYRGQQKPITNFRDYALYISFFPQLVAGPIVRARRFFGDLYHWRAPSGEDVQRGILMIALGLTKKVVFADQLAQIVDPYFAGIPGNPGVLTAWSASIAFALQVYFDFSGYTDIAIGSAKLFGFHFPANFNRPFLATSITELWRRWHISFSKWLRDYIYVPLASRRRGERAVYRNLMITMILGGLWHGASWNFVIWGAYNGALLSVERWWRVRHRRRAGAGTPAWLVPAQAAGTFVLFSMASPLFRGRSFADAVQVTQQMFSGAPGKVLFPPWLIGLLLCSLALAVLEEKWEWFNRLAVAPVRVYACALAIFWFCLEMFAVTEVSIPFVYFQF